MAFETIRGDDLRIVLSPLAQSDYATRLTDANLDAGKSHRLDSATLGEVIVARAEEGSKPFTGHEFPIGDDERDIVHDSSLALALPLNSFIAGWAAAFALADVTSVQEGVTTHFTHTIRPSDPLTATGRQLKVTSIYLDSGGPDAGRLRRVLPSLAVSGFTLSGRAREMAQLALELIGSGQEVINPTITIPALESVIQFSGQSVKLEYGNKGAGLVDITDRLREWSVRVNTNPVAEDGYHPGSGKFRSRLWHGRRTFSLELAVFADRANRDLLDDMLNLTRKEIKLTLDSGVIAGTGTVNHMIVVRVPDCRLTETPLGFEDVGAVFAVRVNENQIYKDAAIADSPLTITVDNTQVSYLT